jgi:glycosyltransferase involved in cell wall biosynthesis
MIAAIAGFFSPAVGISPGGPSYSSMTPLPIPILLMAQRLTQGGSERQLTEIATALDRKLFAPHVAVLRPGGVRLDELRAAGVPTVCVPLQSFASPSLMSAAWRLNRYLRRNGIRLAHSFDVPANIFMVPVARATGVAVVLSSQRAFRSLTPKQYRPLVRFSDRFVDGIVVNCRALERHLVTGENVPASMIRLCYNGINTQFFYRRPPDRPREPGEPLVVGVVCALRPEKDLPTLVRAFAIARRPNPLMHLVIVGDGEMRDPLERLSEELGVRECCEFVPSTTEVPQWLSRIDIFVLPSVSEALSNSLMEAMACECAPVASNVGGNGELVEHGERGLLFEAGDAEELARHLNTLAADEELRRRFAEASRRFIQETFGLTNSVRRMTDIYLEALGRKG